MYTIKVNCENSLEIKKSIFITCLYKVYTMADIEKYLQEVKDEYKDATHYCYAYIIDNIKKASDDKEPSGTAGVPIMDVLEKNKINYILCVVVRYYGGIKLGASGLVRAYSKSARDALSKASLQSLVDGYLVEIKLDYSNIKKLDYLLKDVVILNKDFQDTITYRLLIEKDFLKTISEFNPIILEEVKLEKEKVD